MTQTQQITSSPDLLDALSRVLAGRQDRATEAEQARLRAQREASAPRVNVLIPPEPARANEYVLAQLSDDEKAPGYVKSLGDVFLTDETTGDAIKFDLVAGLPHFLPARFLAEGWQGRECRKLEALGLLTLSVPTRDGSWTVDNATAYGKMLGRVAVGDVEGRLDSPKPSISEEELARAIPIVAAGAPDIAAVLGKLLKGASVPLLTFLTGKYVGGVDKRVVFGG
jgi:hypothetical protein